MPTPPPPLRAQTSGFGPFRRMATHLGPTKLPKRPWKWAIWELKQGHGVVNNVLFPNNGPFAMPKRVVVQLPLARGDPC